MPILPAWARHRVVKWGVLGVSLYAVYKMVVPGREYWQKKYGDDEELITRGQHPDTTRMMQLAAQGYPYQDITRIIAKEKKERYRVLYAKKALERKEEAARREMEKGREASSGAVETGGGGEG